MLQVSDNFKAAMTAPVREFKAKFDFVDSNNTVQNFTESDRVKAIEIQRVGDDSKFFGYTICQRINVKLVDLAEDLNPISKSAMNAELGVVCEDGSVEYVGYPTFYLTERNRDEVEGELSLTGYDKLMNATKLTVGGLTLEAPYTIADFVAAAAEVLECGLYLEGIPEDDFAFYLEYPQGANFEGTENLRDALNQACEATQTIAYIDADDRLHFKRLDVNGAAVATITPDDYYSFSFGDNRRLVKVVHVTELGDNVSSSFELIGTTQYVRNNPFWEMREDIDNIIVNAINNTYALTINLFDVNWRGNLPLEIGDKIALDKTCTDGCMENGYVLNDVITFDGGYSQVTMWDYNDNAGETESNPVTVGDALGQTFAKVDKVNREVTLQAGRIEENSSDISSIKLDTESITATVSEMEKNYKESIDGLGEEVAELSKEVSAKMTTEDVQILISNSMSDGIDKVTTSTGYKFDSEGLSISKSDSDISTQITENGMTVFNKDEEVLVANNEGVKAQNLHATTYLIIGNTTRFEDFIENGQLRTGAFWIG